eukprot:8987486-Pyramimonas_sp.AAC.2
MPGICMYMYTPLRNSGRLVGDVARVPSGWGPAWRAMTICREQRHEAKLLICYGFPSMDAFLQGLPTSRSRAERSAKCEQLRALALPPRGEEEDEESEPNREARSAN